MMTACGGDDAPNAAQSPGEADGDAPVVSAAPKVGQCRGPITKEIFEADTDSRPVVACDQPHGSETAYTGDLPAEVAALPYDQVAALTGDSPDLQPLYQRCGDESDRYMGISRVAGTDAFRPSNLSNSLYIPTAEEWAEGARWFRCEAVTKPGSTVRQPMRAVRSVRF